jgi:hypothetical protein
MDKSYFSEMPRDILIEILAILVKDTNISNQDLQSLKLVSKDFLENMNSTSIQKFMSQRKHKVFIYDPFHVNTKIASIEVDDEGLYRIKNAKSKNKRIYRGLLHRNKKEMFIEFHGDERTSFWDDIIFSPSNLLVMTKNSKTPFHPKEDQELSLRAMKKKVVKFDPEILNIYQKDVFDISNEIFLTIYYSDQTKKKIDYLHFMSVY